MAQIQHCPACDEEYVGGVPACVDCGGPLTAGPLQRYEGGPAPSPAPQPQSDGALDRLLARLPGKQADRTVRVLLMENIACRVSCDGLGKTYTPGQPPSEPFAVSLPVEIFVRAESHETAQEILASLEQEDLIGEQWSDAEPDETIALPVVAVGTNEDASSDDPADTAPEPQGTSVVTAVVVVAVVLGLLFLFGR